jgi:hypothetical protein
MASIHDPTNAPIRWLGLLVKFAASVCNGIGNANPAHVQSVNSLVHFDISIFRTPVWICHYSTLTETRPGFSPSRSCKIASIINQKAADISFRHCEPHVQ